MTRSRPAKRGRARLVPERVDREPEAPDRAASVAAGALAFAVLAAALIVDPSAEDAFEAPKRAAVLLGIAVAAIATWLVPRAEPRESPRWSRPAQIAAGAFLLAVLAAAVSAVVSPRREVALAVLVTGLAWALLPCLGASRALAGGRGRWLVGAVLLGAAVNSGASLAQAAGAFPIFPIEATGSRGESTGALLGNGALVAQLAALAAPAALVLLLAARGSRRAGAAGLLALLLLAVLVNRNLTAVSVLAAGTLMVLLGRARSPGGWRLPVAAGLALGAAVLSAPGLRQRALDAVSQVRAGDLDALLTYRLGPWAAALEMVGERPLAGFGPGTFAAEFVPHRLGAELRWRTRFLNPTASSSYGEAHNEYLQAAAELGLPASVALAVAAVALGAGLFRASRASPGSPEPALLLAALAAAAVAALTWFPLQRSATAAPLLLALGRGFRLAAGRESPGGDAP